MTPKPAASSGEFVLANTVLGTPPLVPEISLRLAKDVLPLWQRTETRGVANAPPPYWAFAWPGGQALARYILDNAEIFRGKRVLDFGAGGGIVAIAAAKAGAIAFAAEIDPLGITAIETNARHNHVDVSATIDDIVGSDQGWDTVCFGDVCYERPLAERIRDWAGSLCNRGCQIFLGDPGRTYFSVSNANRLATYDVPTSRDLEDRDVRETSVYALQPRT